MAHKFIILLVILGLIAVLPVLGQLKLKDINPDETADHTFNERFSLKNSLDRIKQINESLGSFRTLTEKSKGKLSKQGMSKIGNTDWETQNLGFRNWVSDVEGTLRKQDYQIKKLEFELASEKYRSGKIKKEELEQKEACYKKAESEFQKFWDSYIIAD